MRNRITIFYTNVVYRAFQELEWTCTNHEAFKTSNEHRTWIGYAERK